MASLFVNIAGGGSEWRKQRNNCYQSRGRRTHHWGSNSSYWRHEGDLGNAEGGGWVPLVHRKYWDTLHNDLIIDCRDVAVRGMLQALTQVWRLLFNERSWNCPLMFLPFFSPTLDLTSCRIHQFLPSYDPFQLTVCRCVFLTRLLGIHGNLERYSFPRSILQYTGLMFSCFLR